MSLFKQRYDADAKFREEHNKRMHKITKCECGFECPLYNMSHHKKSKRHTKFMYEKTHNEIDNLTKLMLMEYKKQKKRITEYQVLQPIKKELRSIDMVKWDDEYICYMCLNGICYYFGYYPTELHAKFVYNYFAVRLFGSHAILKDIDNFWDDNLVEDCGFYEELHNFEF